MLENINEERIKDFLVDSEILSPEQIEKIQDKIFANSGDEEGNFLETALTLNFIKPDIAEEILTMFFTIPKINLEKKVIDLETYSILPEPISREKKAIVFEKKGNRLSLALTDFENLESLKKNLKDFSIDYFLADLKEINKKIRKYQNLLRENWNSTLFSTLDSVPRTKDFAFQNYDEIEPEYLKEITDSYYSDKFLSSLFEYSLSSQSEFIYFEPEEENYGIYFRIFSQRYKIMEISTETAISLILKLKKYSDINIQEKKTIKEGGFKAELNDQVHDLILSFIQTNSGVKTTIQLDKKIVFPLPFTEICSEQQEIYFKYAEKSSGLILLADDYSFASLAEVESKKNKEIYSVTVNPLEYKIPTISQVLIKKGEKKSLLISQIIKNRPDVLFLDSVTLSLIPILNNFVITGKKVYLKLENNFSMTLEKLLKSVNNNKIIKNISYLITSQEFEKINSETREKYKLNLKEQKQIKSFFSDFNFKKNIFYTKKKKFWKKVIQKNNVEKILVRGIFEINEVLNRKELEKISQKAILENVLSENILKQIDIKDILKFLKF